jgi:Polysaccharide biosynthesis/export protein
MKIVWVNQIANKLLLLWAALFTVSQVGCITYTAHAVPATRLPSVYQAEPKCCKVPVNFTLLRQEPPKEYRVGPGDLLGIYVQGLVPPKAEAPPAIQMPVGLGARDVYPPRGASSIPAAGVPIPVDSQGNVTLALNVILNVNGHTLSEAADVIRRAYKEKQLFAEGKEDTMVMLIRPRVHRVLVMREDVTAEAPQFMRKDQTPYTRRGTGDVIDLPAYENDVLHVLATSGGLPGIETFNHVWVLKSQAVEGNIEDIRSRVQSGEDAEQVFRALDAKRTAIKIPLRVKPGEPLTFGPEDVILHDGDIVYLEPRDTEVFYTGGLLPGGEIPLPRDRDIDVMEAIAIANGSIGGPGGVNGSSVFRSGAGPGNVVPPTRAYILRKLQNGQQLMIRVDLAKAKRDPKERIIIQPGDFIMMHYKPGEITSNVLLNFFNFSFIFTPQ